MIEATKAGCVIEVTVKVRASRTRLLGVRDGRLEVAIAAPPVDGAANRALCKLLAKHFLLPVGRVRIVAGEHHRRKRVALLDADEASVRARLDG